MLKKYNSRKRSAIDILSKFGNEIGMVAGKNKE
jgi:hypothetical protein